MAESSPARPAGSEPEPAQQIALDEDEGVSEFLTQVDRGRDDGETTASVRSSILQHKQQHGRQFHAYKDGTYHRPNDEAELERLEIAHELFTEINNGAVHVAPLQSSNVSRVLDIGTGRGQWAIDFADAYPAATVVGTDISPSMSQWAPPNVQFEVDDIEDDWTYSQPWDYIHCRYMTGSIIGNWPKLMRQCHQNLAPGGWVEFQDFDVEYYSQDGTLTEENALLRWLRLAQGAATSVGRTLRVGKELEGWVREAGFENVQVFKARVPIGRWPRDQKMKHMGMINWTQLYEGLQAVSLRLFLNILGWTQPELEAILTEVRADMKNPNIHALYDVYTVVGQKKAKDAAGSIDE